MRHLYDIGRNAMRERGGTQGGRSRPRRSSVLQVIAPLIVVAVVGLQAGAPADASQARHAKHHHAHHRNAFVQTNLVSDIDGMAKLTDPALRNPWGIAFGPATPAWVNNQFNPASACPADNQDCIPAPEDLLTKVTLYSGANGKTPIAKVGLEVTASSPTGIVFNPSDSFLIDQGQGPTPARFLFNETFVNSAGQAPEGRITGWAPPATATDAPAPTTTSTTARSDPALHFGLALIPAGHHREARLAAANGLTNSIDVFDSSFEAETTGHRFIDPKATKQGFSPYNVMFLKGRVYVAYAGKTRGAISVFSPNGRFLKRLVTSGHLLGPWGMAIAPHHWGRFGGDLLVGNVDSGRINAFDLHDGDFRGALRDRKGHPLVNPGLWGIAFGNGVIGTPRTLLFVAGVGEAAGGFGDEIYEHGLMGSIKPAKHHHHG